MKKFRTETSSVTNGDLAKRDSVFFDACDKAGLSPIAVYITATRMRMTELTHMRYVGNPSFISTYWWHHAYSLHAGKVSLPSFDFPVASFLRQEPTIDSFSSYYKIVDWVSPSCSKSYNHETTRWLLARSPTDLSIDHRHVAALKQRPVEPCPPHWEIPDYNGDASDSSFLLMVQLLRIAEMLHYRYDQGLSETPAAALRNHFIQCLGSHLQLPSGRLDRDWAALLLSVGGDRWIPFLRLHAAAVEGRQKRLLERTTNKQPRYGASQKEDTSTILLALYERQ